MVSLVCAIRPAVRCVAAVVLNCITNREEILITLSERQINFDNVRGVTINGRNDFKRYTS